MRMQSTLIALSLSLAATAALADGNWKFMPVSDAGFKPDVTVSALLGSMDPRHASASSFVGAEVTFNCLAVQPPSGVIRSKLSVGEYKHNGLKLTSYELNPRWMFNLDKDLSAGFGPGIGYVETKAGGVSKGLWAAQVGADLDYRIGSVNLGLAARWQDTRNTVIGTGNKGAENTLVEAKVGYNF